MPNKGEAVVHDTRKIVPTVSQQLPSKKHELFARYLAGGETQSQAYELAGYQPSTSNASTLANRPEIQRRVAALRQEAEERELALRVRLVEAGIDPDDPDTGKAVITTVTADDVRNLLRENARLAQIAGEYKAATEALKLLGDSFGMFSDSTTGKSNGKPAGTQVSVALINQALGGDQDSGGDGAPPRRNPLAPNV
ncbi:hypothetical protein [Sphingobium sp. MK2]|uniref:hypothetical protein n=1 Tax=Sphingobium sp. MK2 TaxID=3116540 RepID=UPI0032E35EA6